MTMEQPLSITPYADGITIIVTVHNEFDNAVKCIEGIRMNAGRDDVDLIVADNASTDGFAEWAGSQQDFTYVRFDEGIEPYGSVLNQIISGLDMRSNVLVMSCRLMVTEGALSAMLQTLHASVETGAVSCISNSLLSPIQQMEPEEFEQFDGTGDFRVYGFMDDAVLFKAETLRQTGAFDDRLFTLFSVTKDYSLRMIKEQLCSVVSRQAYFYAFRNVIDEPDDILIHQDDDNDCLAGKWGVHYISMYGNHHILSLMQADPDNETQVLEIGCDIGATLFFIKEKYPKAVIHGCDLNPGSVAIASNVMDAFVNNIEDENLPFEEGSLDVVIFADVLEHLRDPLKTIQYIHRLLKPGGRILASIPNLMHISVMRQLLHGDFTYTETGLLDKTHIHFFTYNEMERMFAEGGYKIERFATAEQDLTAQDLALIDKLVALDPAAKPFMYRAFQLLVSAVRD